MTNGIRQSLGLFIRPIEQASGLGIATISFALAVGQFVVGFAQPFSGAIADRYGAGRVLICGVLLVAVGAWVTSPLLSPVGIVFSLGILLNLGIGFCSFAVLIGSVSNEIPVQKRGVANGTANAGSSLGQFVFPPIIQALIAKISYSNAFYVMGVLALVALPLIVVLQLLAKKARKARDISVHILKSPKKQSLKSALRTAFSDKSYTLIHLSFFTCGFYVAFISTHLPGEIAAQGLSPEVASWSLAIIGIANVVGSLSVGNLVSRYRAKWLLFWIYTFRTILCGVYLAMPKTNLSMYIMSTAIGLLWLSTVPPTACIVGKLYGTQYLGSLFGLTLLSHQIGAFLGAYTGGLNVLSTGNFVALWWAVGALSLFAALCNIPIPEPHLT